MLSQKHSINVVKICPNLILNFFFFGLFFSHFMFFQAFLWDGGPWKFFNNKKLENTCFISLYFLSIDQRTTVELGLIGLTH